MATVYDTIHWVIHHPNRGWETINCLFEIAHTIWSHMHVCMHMLREKGKWWWSECGDFPSINVISCVYRENNYWFDHQLIVTSTRKYIFYSVRFCQTSDNINNNNNNNNTIPYMHVNVRSIAAQLRYMCFGVDYYYCRTLYRLARRQRLHTVNGAHWVRLIDNIN